MSRCIARTAVTAVVLATVALSARAHDFWLSPSAHAVPVGADVSVHVLIGPPAEAEPYPRNPANVLRFFATSADGEREVAGQPGDEPAGHVVLSSPGTVVISYRSRQSRVELEADKFERYLREEGLGNVLAVRAAHGAGATPGREIFSRCAKTLIVVGAPDATGHARRIGLDLELVPEAAPWLVPAGGVLPVRVLLRGAPLARSLVRAVRIDADSAPVEARSDADGLVRLAVNTPGRWLVKTVQASPAPAGLPPELAADWESLWASLTFEIPAEIPRAIPPASQR